MKTVLEWRARGLVSRLAPFVTERDRVLDVGCGTGHNGERLMRERSVDILGLDVVDMSVVGPKPRLYDGRHIPFGNDTFDVSVLIYMLHYVDDPVCFLKEVKRVTRKRIVIIQTTGRGAAGRGLHRFNEWLFGTAAFCTARAFGLVGNVPFSMSSKHDLSSDDVLGFGKEAALGLEASQLESYAGFLPLGRFTCAFSKAGQS